MRALTSDVRYALVLSHLALGAWLCTAHGATYDLSGRVLGPDGGPVAGASVHQYRFCMNDPSASGVRATVLSRVDGSFEMGDVAFDHVGGVYDTLVAVRQGYGFACWQSHSWKQTRMPPALRLTEEAVLRGVVVDERGNAVAGAAMSVLYVRYRRDVRSLRFSADFERRAPLPQLTSTTDARGHFSLPQLPKLEEGHVTLFVQHPAAGVAVKDVLLCDVARSCRVMLEPPGAIEGRVACEGTGAPGAGLWVRAYGRFLGDGARAAARCEPNGKYLLTSLPPGDYTVRVRLPPSSQWTSTHRRGIQVLPEQTVQDADVRLIEGGIVSGMVIDATTAEPVAGVSVGERFPERWAHERTRTDGRFRLRLPMGMRSVYPSGVPVGYVKPDSNDALAVTARDGRTSAGPILELHRSVTLEGKVVDPSQQPVAAAMVTAWLPKRRPVWTWGPEPYPVSGTTDSHGAFRLAGMPPDEQVLLEVIALRARLGASLGVIPDRGAGRNVLVKLVPLATVTGRVVDKEGRAVADARATLSYPGMVRMGGTIANPVTRTGSDGRYEFVVAPGRELVIKVGRDKSPRVVPEAGQRHELKDIVTRSHITADVCGRVVDADGKPVYLARVALRAAWHRKFTTATDARGEFKFSQVHSEGSSIRIEAQDRQGVLFGQARVRSLEGLGPVEVRLARTCGVAGRVVNQEGLPIPGAQIEMLVRVGGGAYGIASTWSDGNGSYRFEGLRGKMAPLSGRRGYVSTRAAGYGRADSKSLTFQSGKILTVDDIVLRRANSSVSGTVTDTDGTPLAGVSVNCGGMHAYTDVRGRYRIEGLPGNRTRDVHVGHRRYHRDSRRSVQPGSTDIDFALTPKSPPKATVRAAVGRPAPEPQVTDWLNTPGLNLSDLRGRAVLICFWTRYSRPCVRSMQRLNRLSKQHSDRLTIIAIHDRAAPVAEVREFVKENHIEFPVGIVKSAKNDGWDGETFSAYGIKSLPATFLVDKKGVLRYAHVADGLEGKVATLVEE